MPLIEYDFRCDVLRRSTDGEGAAFVEYFGEPEVCEFEVAVVADQQVFGFEVAEDDVFGVHILEGGRHRGRIESALVGGQCLDRPEMGEQLAAVDKLQHEIEVLAVLRETLEGDDEGLS
jgi:hypothetical protein